MGHRIRIAAAGLAVTALALAGCSAGAETPDAEPAETGPVTLEFWAWGSNVDKRVAVWNEENPDIQVNISAPGTGTDFPAKILAAVRAGEGPDIAQAEFTQLPSYVSAGIAAELNDVRDELDAAFSETVMETVTFDDTVFGVPQDLGPVLSVYRSDIFEQNGLEPATTWDEFRELAEQVRTLDGDRYLANLSSLDADLVMGLALQAGAQWWEYADGEWQVNIDDEATARVLDFWQGLVEDDLVSTYLTNSPEFIEATATGRIISNLSGAWAPGPLMNQYPDTVGLWDAAQIPQWEAGEEITFARGGSADFVLADSPHKAAATEFLLWLNASDEGAEGLVEINKFTAATHGQEIDRTPPALMPDNTEYWPSAKVSADNLTTVQWGPNTQIAFSTLNDALGAAMESGDWSDVLSSTQAAVEEDLK